jgi:hypothetical protein
MLGFDLNLYKIQARGDSIYRAFRSPTCVARIQSRPFPESEFNSPWFTIQRRIHIGEAFPFGSVREDSRGTTTRSVGPLWVDFGQTGPGNGEASGLRTLKS